MTRKEEILPARSARLLLTGSWSLAAAVSLLAITAWTQDLYWRFDNFTAYMLFPLFGLLAYSIMWSHYMAGAARRLTGLPKPALRSFLRISGWAVLVLICLHPGLLIFRLWRDGFGLPPSSYLHHYVAPHLEWVALLGTVSFLVFLAYESKRWLGDKPWWKWVARAGDLAMIAIFYHGLRLGGTLQHGWFRGVWLLYGILLVTALAYTYRYDA